MKNSIFWAIFYTIIAATLFICVIFGNPSTSSGYKTAEYALIAAIVVSILAIYWVRKAIKHIFY